MLDLGNYDAWKLATPPEYDECDTEPSREQVLFDALRDAQRRLRVVGAAHAAAPSPLTAAAVEAAADAELEAEVALNAEVGRG